MLKEKYHIILWNSSGNNAKSTIGIKLSNKGNGACATQIFGFEILSEPFLNRNDDFFASRINAAIWMF